MSTKIKNARVVYSLFCKACATGISLKGFDKISTKNDCHLMGADCPNCGTGLSLDYNKALNQVVATVKETPNDN